MSAPIPLPHMGAPRKTPTALGAWRTLAIVSLIAAVVALVVVGVLAYQQGQMAHTISAQAGKIHSQAGEIHDQGETISSLRNRADACQASSAHWHTAATELADDTVSALNNLYTPGYQVDFSDARAAIQAARDAGCSE